MMNDVMKVILKVNLGINHIFYLINGCKGKPKLEKTRHVRKRQIERIYFKMRKL